MKSLSCLKKPLLLQRCLLHLLSVLLLVRLIGCLSKEPAIGPKIIPDFEAKTLAEEVFLDFLVVEGEPWYLVEIDGPQKLNPQRRQILQASLSAQDESIEGAIHTDKRRTGEITYILRLKLDDQDRIRSSSVQGRIKSKVRGELWRGHPNFGGRIMMKYVVASLVASITTYQKPPKSNIQSKEIGDHESESAHLGEIVYAVFGTKKFVYAFECRGAVLSRKDLLSVRILESFGFPLAMKFSRGVGYLSMLRKLDPLNGISHYGHLYFANPNDRMTSAFTAVKLAVAPSY